MQHAPLQLPETFKATHPETTAKALYKICVGTDGRVFETSVMTTVGESAVDESLMQQIRDGWTYTPSAEAVCTAVAVQLVVP